MNGIMVTQAAPTLWLRSVACPTSSPLLPLHQVSNDHRDPPCPLRPSPVPPQSLVQRPSAGSHGCVMCGPSVSSPVLPNQVFNDPLEKQFVFLLSSKAAAA